MLRIICASLLSALALSALAGCEEELPPPVSEGLTCMLFTHGSRPDLCGADYCVAEKTTVERDIDGGEGLACYGSCDPSEAGGSYRYKDGDLELTMNFTGNEPPTLASLRAGFRSGSVGLSTDDNGRRGYVSFRLNPANTELVSFTDGRLHVRAMHTEASSVFHATGVYQCTGSHTFQTPVSCNCTYMGDTVNLDLDITVPLTR